MRIEKKKWEKKYKEKNDKGKIGVYKKKIKKNGTNK